MAITECQLGEYTISTDKARLDLNLIHDFLHNSSYWARDRSLATIQKSIEHSLCFGVYRGDTQVGFARVVTDYATFAWLCDVFVVEAYRGQGLGKKLVDYIATYPELQDMLFLLATRDAHGLYQTYGGFEKLGPSDRWMKRRVA